LKKKERITLNDNLMTTSLFEAVDPVNIDKITDLLLAKYKFDLRNYAPMFLNRRIVYIMQKYKVSNVNEFINRLLDANFFQQFLSDFIVCGTDFFRDTSVWEQLIKTITEWFSEKKQFRVWFPECGTGEELYSFTIFIKENSFYDKCLITASTISAEKIAYIKKGMYEGRAEHFDLANYTKLEFKSPAFTYFKIIDTAFQLNLGLLDNVQFESMPNVLQKKENDFDLILFRNVMLMYNKPYQINVLENIYKSLRHDGLLIIGVNEQLLSPDIENKFKMINKEGRIYQKI